jgi:hypothetical protein
MIDALKRTYCEYAAERLKAAGFVHHYTSMKSEACYYRYPGRNCLIRIATHAGSRAPKSLPAESLPTVARITFGQTYNPKSWDAVDAQICRAVGRYFMWTGDGEKKGREEAA